jgi:hypothetical protein
MKLLFCPACAWQKNLGVYIYGPEHAKHCRFHRLGVS